MLLQPFMRKSHQIILIKILMQISLQSQSKFLLATLYAACNWLQPKQHNHSVVKLYTNLSVLSEWWLRSYAQLFVLQVMNNWVGAWERDSFQE